MFKMKFMDDSIGCNPEEETNIEEMSHKRFLCKIVDNDPLENIVNNNYLEKKLISKNINETSYYSNQYINTINDVHANRYTRTKQFKCRKRIIRKYHKICI